MLSKAKTKGFTLVELVVVVVIIGILAAVAAPKFMNKTDAAKAQVSLQKLALVKNAVEMIRADDGSYPSSSAALTTKLNDYVKGGIPRIEFGTLNGSDIHVFTAASDPTALSGVSNIASGSEYIYNATTGSVWINDSDLFDGKYNPPQQ